jgi:uncharacterized membrane protein required for colicin V production
MPSGFDRWQFFFLAVAVLFVLYRALRGWQLGLVRQLISLAALGCAYFVAIFGGPLLVPMLRPLGIPDGILGMVGGAILGLLVYGGMALFGAVLFKKTAHQRVGIVRFGYGSTGAIFGALMGLFIVWIGVLVIRVLGTVAETQVEAAKHPVTEVRGKPTPRPVPEPPNAMVRGLAMIKHSLEQGTAGAMVEQVDPIPGTLYSLLTRLGRMLSSEQSIDRFLAFPGVKTLTQHPKIAALQSDPDIARDLVSQNYFALIRNERIIRAANDAEIAQLMTQFEFEKALDYALQKPRTVER